MKPGVSDYSSPFAILGLHFDTVLILGLSEGDYSKGRLSLSPLTKLEVLVVRLSW